MAGSFKVPKLRKLEKKAFPLSSGRTLKKRKRSAVERLASFFLVNTEKRDEKVVVKKVKDKLYDGKACCFNDEFEFNLCADVMPKCAKDIVTGLQHLHHMHITHCDLNPGNILVSNQHYSTSNCIFKIN